VIKFTNVFKAFPKGGLALKDVSFHVGKGEFAFLTGHSGAGKSTVMKLIYAEERPTSGEVRVSGYNVNEMRPREVPMLRRKLGIVFQDFRLLEDRTAEENIAFALEVTSARSSTIAARVMRVLTQVGLAAKAQAYPRELSAVVMATHDLDLVRQAPYRVIELQEGALVYDSAVDEARDQATAGGGANP